MRLLDRHPRLAALVLGALAACGYAPLDLWPLTLLCFAAWLALVHRAPGVRAALSRGWLFGWAHLSVANNWIARAFTLQDAMPHWLGYPAVGLLCLYLAIYPMMAAGLAWRWGKRHAAGERPGPGFVLMAGAAWVLTEALRGWALTGYPWPPLASLWVPIRGVAQLAAWVGTYALSGLTVVLAGALLLLAERRWRAAAVGLPLVLLLALVPPRVPQAPMPDAAPRVRAVQPDLPEEERPGPDYAEHNLQALERLSGRPGAAPRLIVWPEGALRYLIEDGYPADYYWRQESPARVRARLARLLGPRDLLLTGGTGVQFTRQGEIETVTNSIFAVDARGALRGRYDKAHLVPWGEYLPWRPLLSKLGFARLVPGGYDFAPGPGPRSMALPGFGPVGMLICYEVIFSGHIVDPARRPRLIFNPSNDSWYGRWGPAQHLAMARLRAIEEGLPIVRATPTGISAIIAADGRLLGTVPPERAGAIEAVIPPAAAPTLFARLGNWLALIVGGLLGASAVAFRRWGR
ncbi:MAG: apolipoprotein N-acyltransferase [Proteobacteria bacterium SG_bin5]|nr:apolipoprotein N-acyltransferase [Sphingomonas sp.]OQW40585.1 MAG: apolipoprotein N-acyltransferase [Proteobacteria bacterium SG_bin5]